MKKITDIEEVTLVQNQLTKVTPYDFSENTDEERKTFVDFLREKQQKELGSYGLSAIQCGYNIRMFVIGAPPYEYDIWNPEVLEYSEDIVSFEEGDKLETLYKSFTTAPIRRPVWVRVKYFNHKGEEQHKQFEGLTARIFQHEFDNLEGESFIDKAHWIDLDRAKNKRKIKMRRLKKKLKEEQKYA